MRIRFVPSPRQVARRQEEVSQARRELRAEAEEARARERERAQPTQRQKDLSIWHEAVWETEAKIRPHLVQLGLELPSLEWPDFLVWKEGLEFTGKGETTDGRQIEIRCVVGKGTGLTYAIHEID